MFCFDKYLDFFHYTISPGGLLCAGLYFFLSDRPQSEKNTNELGHEISNNVECATSKGSDKPAHTRSLIRDFASRLNIL